MNFEEFKHINLAAGRPDALMTDAKWQKRFAVMRTIVTPSLESKMSKRVGGIFVNGERINDNIDKTQLSWIRYRSYINDVLSQIRQGKHDYCYFIYQITDLLRYENTRLQTRYFPDGEYFEVWLAD